MKEDHAVTFEQSWSTWIQETACRFFATGTFEWGDQCAFTHGGGDAAAAPATPKAKAKSKSKAKSKAKPDTPAVAAVRKGKKCRNKEE